MKFQEPDLRGLSLEELKIRNGRESVAAEKAKHDKASSQRAAAAVMAVQQVVMTR